MTNVTPNKHVLDDDERVAEAKRESILESHRLRNASTYHAHAQAEATEIRGRFADRENAEMAARAQAKPASGPWNDPVVARMNSAPDTFGVAIDAHKPVGEPFEQARAAEILEARDRQFEGMSTPELIAEHGRLTGAGGPIMTQVKYDKTWGDLELRRIALEKEIRRRNERRD